MFKVGYWRYIVAGVCLVGASCQVFADSLDEQRQRYQQIKLAWDSNQLDVVSQLMPTLRDYPLYPYLEYRALTQDVSLLSTVQVKQFIATHPTLPAVRTLNNNFINELARRQDWSGLLSFSPEQPKPVAARCNYLYARLMVNQPQGIWDQTRDIWLTGRSLPPSCDKLFTAWQQSGGMTSMMVLERMRLAMGEGNSGLVSHLARQLPPDYKTITDALLRLQNTSTKTVERFARSVGPTDFTRKALLAAFSRIARQDPDSARSLLPQLVRLQRFGSQDRQTMDEDVAWRFMGTDVSDEQARWRDVVIAKSKSAPLIERRVRLALGQDDHQGLSQWLTRLPAEVLQKDEWRYWRAVLLIEQGQREDGENQLRDLMKQRGFYPMAAAQRLNLNYPLTTVISARPDRSIGQLPEIARIRELMYWRLESLARSEWAGLVASRDRPQQEALARFAFEQRWYDLSVQATIVAKLWDNLEERFPLAWNDEFRQATQGKGISQSYAMAIARQESAWNPQARSSVGAAGLMQLMPATAQHTAQMFNVTSYSDSSQLLDPQMNIQLGSSYLEYVYQSFGQNRILASAAYNAGPSRVSTWLKNSEGRIDAVAFVESIPFSETRGYVKNVLAYDVFYRNLLSRPTQLMTDSEWRRRY
ncbi:murein transglycosylase [Musicola paradisiaca]|uniref:peptidoglycan lytic exotransglycosylase n=1 Tax=Musicola paradisiaca (strain Ech703) TaxID=579405 RepID=C6C9C4_MUSP7|nr:murein transglycosylase [Musicola paradisiaca]ACS84375.1 Lytic transglycosylase catalytic [Musicola paradisiaca Ech703]